MKSLFRSQIGIENNFKAFKTCFTIVAIMLLTSSCTGSIMTTVKPYNSSVASDKVLVTFLRPSNYGWAIAPSIWDGEKLIGTQEVLSYIQYFTDPGEHIFLSKHDNWNYLKAYLEPGKQYYVHTRVWAGFASKGVILDPVKNNNQGEVNWETINEWIKMCKPMGINKNDEKVYIESKLFEVKQAIQVFHSGNIEYKLLEATDGR